MTPVNHRTPVIHMGKFSVACFPICMHFYHERKPEIPDENNTNTGTTRKVLFTVRHSKLIPVC